MRPSAALAPAYLISLHLRKPPPHRHRAEGIWACRSIKKADTSWTGKPETMVMRLDYAVHFRICGEPASRKPSRQSGTPCIRRPLIPLCLSCHQCRLIPDPSPGSARASRPHATFPAECRAFHQGLRLQQLLQMWHDPEQLTHVPRGARLGGDHMLQAHQFCSAFFVPPRHGPNMPGAMRSRWPLVPQSHPVWT